MASVADGGLNCTGNLSVLGNAGVNGDLAVIGALTPGSLATAGGLDAGTRVKLTPTASPPAVAAEGMLYADTDHKLYYYNGTDWKEVAFV